MTKYKNMREDVDQCGTNAITENPRAVSLCLWAHIQKPQTCRVPFPETGADGADGKYFNGTGSFANHAGREDMKMRNEMDSPCLTCCRVKNPGECENKNCRQWRSWFLESWDRARNLPSLQRQLKKPGIGTETIGGTAYGYPHRIREYLAQDPCMSCPFPKEYCYSPCPAKRNWIEIKKELRK